MGIRFITNRLIVVLLAVVCAQAQSNRLPPHVTLIPKADDSATGELRFLERKANGTNYVGMKAPASVSSNIVWTMPGADGSNGQCVQTDGSGVLSFGSCGSSSSEFVDDVFRVQDDGDNTKKIAFQVSGITTGTTRTYTFQDVSSTIPGLEISQSWSGSQTFASTTLTRTVRPSLDLSYDLGTSSFYYSTSYINTMLGRELTLEKTDNTNVAFVLTAKNGVTTVSSWNVAAETTGSMTFYNAKDALTPLRITSSAPEGAVVIDSSGVTLADDIFADNADFAPSGQTGNYLKTRKLEVTDLSGGTTFWDVQANATATGSNLYIRDNSGNTILNLNRIAASTTFDRAEFRMHVVPSADNTYDLGVSGLDWRNLRLDGDALVGGALTVNGSVITATSANASFSIVNAVGSPAYRVSGTTVIDASRNLTNIGTITASGAINTSSSYQISGSTVIDASRNLSTGNVNPSSDGLSALGSDALRYTNLVVSSQIVVRDNGAVNRFAASSSGSLTIKNSGGTTTLSHASSSGDLDITGVYRNNGTAGIGQTFSVRNSADTGSCSITTIGGIVTATTC